MSRFKLGMSTGLLVLVLAVGCDSSGGAGAPGEDVAGGSTDVAASEDVASWSPESPAVCGAPQYTWLPADAVGGVVSWEEMAISNLSAQALNGLLAGSPFEPLAPVTYGVRNFKMRYTTQDRGQAVEATALVSVPVGLDAGALPPMALWLHGTSGFHDACAPSLAMAGMLPVAVLGALGYVVVAPDYIGMVGFGDPSPEGNIHPYMVGEAAAIATLDATRAALLALSSDVDLVNGDPQRLIPWGGSQGGHAAMYTDLYAPYYAPELTVFATVAAIVPLDLIDQTTFSVSPVGASTFNVASVMTAMRRWYDGDMPLTEILTDTDPLNLASTYPELMQTVCESRHLSTDFAAVDDPKEIFTPDFLAKASAGDWDDLEPWNCYLTENSIARSSIPRLGDAPVLATFAENDEMVNALTQKPYVATLCERGYRVETVECAGLDHIGGGLATMPYMHRWVQQRLAGADWPEGDACDLGSPVDCTTLPTAQADAQADSGGTP